MWCLSRPTPETVAQFLEAQQRSSFSYHAVGATATTPPAGYVLDHTRVRLGEGEQAFLDAKSAIQHWRQFELGWVHAAPDSTPIQTGQVIAVVANLAGLWWLNACRLVYVIDEPSRYGFAYGTLADHAESGEERFLVEWDQQQNTVWYDIYAFSRPRHVLARMGYPIVRRLQKRFARNSAATMQRIVEGGM